VVAAELGAEAPPRRPALQRVLLALRFLVPAAVFGYLLSIVPLRDTLQSLGSIPLRALAFGFAIQVLGVVVAAVRWRLLFPACGIEERPSVLALFRVHLIGMFYNSFLPGGLGGEVVRAIAIRPVMGARGFPGAMAIVLLERVLGVVGLLVIVSVTFAVFPLAQIPNVMLFSMLGLGVSAAAVLCIAGASRLAPYLPGPLSKIAAALPSIRNARLFTIALLLSIVTQSVAVFVGHVLLSSINGNVALTDAMVVMPLISAAQYFPITVGGAGVREALFVLLYGRVGVAEPDALAAALAFAAVAYATAGLGGVLHALKPLSLER